MIGRTDKLAPWKAIEHWKAKGLDLTPILHQPEVGPEVGRYRQIDQDHGIEKSLDVTKLLDICEPAIERGVRVHADLPIRNVTVSSARLSAVKSQRSTGRTVCRRRRFI